MKKQASIIPILMLLFLHVVQYCVWLHANLGQWTMDNVQVTKYSLRWSNPRSIHYCGSMILRVERHAFICDP